jgi:predicted metal-dependent phosphoesterase TrpH
MHTTASDGRLSPAELVARVVAAKLTTISVTDHDTVASIEEVTTLAAAAGVRVIPGIEITAIDDGRDVHMLGYFFDQASPLLTSLLVNQRALRVQRVREIAARLAALNMFVDVESVLKASAVRPGSSVGRPQLARELVRTGHVESVNQAFELWLATGRPAFVPRTGPSPASVIETLHAAGGVASFAHPGVTKRDDLLAPLIDRGLDAIEVYHSDHTPDDVMAYRNMAIRFNALVSGGSDFHGEDPPSAEASTFAKATADKTGGKPSKPGRRHRSTFGIISLPQADFAALEASASAKASARQAPKGAS